MRLELLTYPPPSMSVPTCSGDRSGDRKFQLELWSWKDGSGEIELRAQVGEGPGAESPNARATSIWETATVAMSLRPASA